MFDCRQTIFQERTEKGFSQHPEIAALSGQMVRIRDFLERKCPGVVAEERVEQEEQIKFVHSSGGMSGSSSTTQSGR